MLFNSIEFIIFIVIIFFSYWYIAQKKKIYQNILILCGSYIFYAWWDYRFLSLIFFSTVIDFFLGRLIYNSKTKKNRRTYLSFSLITNLGLLIIFKYFNFFIESWVDLISLFGYKLQSTWTLNIILPVGISFYTFQTISYSIDIYYNKIKPTNDFIAFAAFVSFFPQLVAGPIERAANLLPQFFQERKFKYYQAVEGLRLILWGMFKKVVIADSLAPYVDSIFTHYQSMSGGELFSGMIFFTFQIYADFSGYSDIAIGSAKLFNIELTSNFNFPLYSRNISELWRRWHISLSNWFKDYFFMPLLIRFRDHKTFGVIIVTIITYLIIGLWHGADYKYLAFGLIQGILFIPIIVFKKTEPKFDYMQSNNRLQNIYDTFKVLKTFIYFSLSLIIFRSDSLYDGFNFIINMLSDLSLPNQYRGGYLIVALLLLFDWNFRNNERLPYAIHNYIMRYFIYTIHLYLIFSNFLKINQTNFIYFQF